jgi:hypothetical protein
VRLAVSRLAVKEANGLLHVFGIAESCAEKRPSIVWRFMRHPVRNGGGRHRDWTAHATFQMVVLFVVGAPAREGAYVSKFIFTISERYAHTAAVDEAILLLQVLSRTHKDAAIKKRATATIAKIRSARRRYGVTADSAIALPPLTESRCASGVDPASLISEQEVEAMRREWEMEVHGERD